MKKTELLTNEHIETLGNGTSVIVSPEHTFGTDAMLLAYFAQPKKNCTACDFGTGCGIIPFLWARDGLCKKILGVEIQEQGYNQFVRGIELNSLSDKVTALNCDLRELKGKADFGVFDLVTMNPPYKKENAGIISEKQNEKIARHETLCNFDGICATASSLLKFSGRFCICIRPERMFEMMETMARYKLEPKRLRLVVSREGEKPWLCLIEARLGGKTGMTVENSFILYGADGRYTDEMNSLLREYREE
ncbi:MAG: methyltransferase [Ruminococcaceae bacterium]|nr:methyltransferase [Oscillospiraceae bacterium]